MLRLHGFYGVQLNDGRSHLVRLTAAQTQASPTATAAVTAGRFVAFA